MRTIYQIENRGDFIFFHWFMLIIPALKEVEHLQKPIYFNIQNSRKNENKYEYINATLDLLKPEYQYVDDITDNDKIIVIKEPYLLHPNYVQDKYYHFVRNNILLKNNLETKITPNRLIYISRCNEKFPDFSTPRRQIINEDDFKQPLINLGFEFIYLENYDLLDKIKIFQESKIIVTPNGGALTMGLFANKNIKVIEIHDDKSPNENQYYHIFKTLNIPIVRYTDVTSIDENKNIVLNPCLNYNYNLIVNDLSRLISFIKSYM